MSALSNAKWIGLRASLAMYSFGGAGRGAGAAARRGAGAGGGGPAGGGGAGGGGGGAGAAGGGGAGAGAAGGGAGAGAGAASRTVATGRLAQAATKRSPMIIVARIERSMNVRTVVPPLLFSYTTSVLIHLYGPMCPLNGTLVG